MNQLIKKSLINNKTLKLVSLFLGMGTWGLLSNSHTTSRWIEVPICFYNVPDTMKVSAKQEKMLIEIRGKLADIKQCQDIQLHINASSFKPGQQRFQPCQEQLFLPKSVKLVHNKPLFLDVTTALA